MEMTRRKLLIGARYLSFSMEDESYCIDILMVKELMGMAPLTPLPRTPDFIRGVINLRGQIIPIVDLRLKFGLAFREYGRRTSIIVTEIPFCGETILMGLVVDSIQEVVSIPDDKLTHLPYINSRVRAEYIRGVAETGDGIKIVLDVQKVLNDGELDVLKDASAAAVQSAAS